MTRKHCMEYAGCILAPADEMEIVLSGEFMDACKCQYPICLIECTPTGRAVISSDLQFADAVRVLPSNGSILFEMHIRISVLPWIRLARIGDEPGALLVVPLLLK